MKERDGQERGGSVAARVYERGREVKVEPVEEKKKGCGRRARERENSGNFHLEHLGSGGTFDSLLPCVARSSSLQGPASLQLRNTAALTGGYLTDGQSQREGGGDRGRRKEEPRGKSERKRDKRRRTERLGT